MDPAFVTATIPAFEVGTTLVHVMVDVGVVADNKHRALAPGMIVNERRTGATRHHSPAQEGRRARLMCQSGAFYSRNF